MGTFSKFLTVESPSEVKVKDKSRFCRFCLTAVPLEVKFTLLFFLFVYFCSSLVAPPPSSPAAFDNRLNKCMYSLRAHLQTSVGVVVVVVEVAAVVMRVGGGLQTQPLQWHPAF